jgi:methylmalonyl-CoA carboxyltransferase large subunit
MEESVNAADTLEALRQEIARLSERVAALEKAREQEAETPTRSARAAPPCHAASEPHSPAPAREAEGLSEELILVISAAIAAFLGKKPHIRQIRLVSTAAWAQQGRATIQASHALPVHHGHGRS